MSKQKTPILTEESEDIKAAVNELRQSFQNTGESKKRLQSFEEFS